MLKYILVTLTLVISGNVFAQDNHPVFVDKFHMDWFKKEVKKLNDAIAAFEKCPSNQDYIYEGKIKKSLRSFDANIGTIYDQMAKHLDQERIDQLKQEYVDGIGVKYYLDVKKFRNSPAWEEFEMNESQLNSFLNKITEISEIRTQFLNDHYSENQTNDKTATLAYLKRANSLVSSTESLLSGSAIN